MICIRPTFRPGRPGPTRFGLIALLAAAPLFFAEPGQAQSQEGESPLDPISAFGSGTIGLTQVAESSTWFAGVELGLLFRDRFSIAGAARSLLEDVKVAGLSPESSFRLEMWYWGVLPAYRIPFGEKLGGTVGALLGGGNAKVSTPVNPVELGASNFAVVEPEATLRYALHRVFSISLSAAYRFTFWESHLPGVGDGDLQGPSLGLRVQVGR